MPRYKRPESVLVVVYTATGAVLVLRRCQPVDFWQSVTGSLHWTETDPLAAAQRELFEETGLGAGLEVVDCGVICRFPILPAWRHRYAPGVTENLEYRFRVQVAQPCPITLNPLEHGEYLWLPRATAAARMSSWTNRDAVLELPR